ENAENHNAKHRAPQSYNIARIKYNSAARSIEANRRNPEAYHSAVAESVASAQKLNEVLNTVINSKTSERAAIQIYDQQEQLKANQASLQDAKLRAQEAMNKEATTQQ